MIHCNPLQDKHIQEIDKLKEHFFKSKNLARVYGDADGKWIQEQFKLMWEDMNHIPYHESYVPKKNGKLDMSVYKQMRDAIDKWDKSLSQSVNGFEALFRAPSGIYRKNPVTINFNNKVTSILNFERKNKTNYVDDLKKISGMLTEVMSAVNSKDGSYNKVSKKINKIYDDISKYIASDRGDLASSKISELNDILNSVDTKKVLKTYADMMENFTFNEINKINKNTIHPEYNTEVLLALKGVVKESKAYLNRMGKVNVTGLKKMKDVIDRMFAKSRSTNYRTLKNRVDDAINRVEKGMEDGKYFPHYAVDSLIHIEDLIDNIDPFRISKDENYTNQVIIDIGNAISDLPSSVESASRKKTSLFINDPIRVLESYGMNATIFNKKQHLMDAFLETMENLKPSQTDFDGLDQMAEFIAHKYAATTKGFYEANDSVKKTAQAISRLQTVSKMGLSLTGSVRNATQHFWYVNYVGYKRYNKGRKLLKANETFTYSVDDSGAKSKTMAKIIEDVSDEHGYFFDNAAMETIAKGGLLDMDGVDKKSIRLETDENGNPYIEFKKDGIWQKIDKASAKATGGALAFHQFTENIVRKDVYRNAFANHFQSLFRNEEYKNGLAQDYIKNSSREMSMESAMAMVHKKIERDSHNMALNWVRMTQFEYSTPDRANMFGGGTDNKSAIGNVLFQFFPYASQMFEMNKRVYTEGLKATFNGDFNSWKFGAMARMFGFQTFGIGLASIIFNNEFRYLIENDTFSRLETLYELFTTDDISEADFGNGLIQQLTGPAVADMLFWMEAAGFTEFDENDTAQLMLGYYGLEEMAESDRERAILNRMSVTAAKLHKSRESFINGDLTGMLRNIFLLYPSGETKQRHDQLMNMLGLQSERSQRSNREETANSTILSLPEDQRQKILSVIQDLKKDTQVDRSIPTGLENLTIR